MKQSTKLLSLVLALVLAFGCFSVIGNAALVKSEVAWDNIDDAKLTAEQVADLALDMVDADVPMLCSSLFTACVFLYWRTKIWR